MFVCHLNAEEMGGFFFLSQKVRIPIYHSNRKRKRRYLILIFYSVGLMASR